MENINPDNKTDLETANRVSVTTIVVNTAFAVLQFIAGILAQSAAMISSAVHTLSDLLTTFIVIIGVNMAAKKSDDEHQYGHERFECTASIILALILAITGVGIGWSGVKSIMSGEFKNNIPKVAGGVTALAAAFSTIAVKEWMYRYTRKAAKKINSGVLMADAWHHRSDALATAGAFIGVLGAIAGFPVLDSAASILICLFIIKAACDVFTDAIDKMVDKSCDEKTLVQLERIVRAQPGVEGVDWIKTRIFGSKIYVDIEIAVYGNLTLTQAHSIAEDVHDAVENQFPLVKHCMVHVNPNAADAGDNI